MLFLCATAFRETLEKVAPMESPRTTGMSCLGRRLGGSSELMQNESCHIFQRWLICCYECKAAQWKPKTGTCNTYGAPLTLQARDGFLPLQTSGGSSKCRCLVTPELLHGLLCSMPAAPLCRSAGQAFTMQVYLISDLSSFMGNLEKKKKPTQKDRSLIPLNLMSSLWD